MVEIKLIMRKILVMAFVCSGLQSIRAAEPVMQIDLPEEDKIIQKIEAGKPLSSDELTIVEDNPEAFTKIALEEEKAGEKGWWDSFLDYIKSLF